MSYDRGLGYDIAPYDRNIILNLSYDGLQLLRCANWDEGPNHGGIITTYVVTSCWDHITEYENINGVADYRKGFIKNFGALATGTSYIRPVFSLPSDLVGRFTVEIAQGTASDNMTNKPADTAFASLLTISLAPDETVPIWIKRTVTAGGSPAKTYLGLQFYLTATQS